MSVIEIVFGLFSLAIIFILIDRRRSKNASQKIEDWKRKEAARVKKMLDNSVGWDYEECRSEARRIMDSLHPNLEFIEDQTIELDYGWKFRFAIPTDDPTDPWEYLIGCSNELFINKHTGKVEDTPEGRKDGSTGVRTSRTKSSG